MAESRPSSTLVNVAEHAELRLVQLLADSAPANLLGPSFASDCESRIASADAAGLIRTVLGNAGAMTSLFSIEPADEAVSAFSLLAALLDRESDPASARSAASEMADAAAGRGQSKNAAYDASKGASMLCALYNLRSDPSEKCALLRKIVAHVSSTCPDLLQPGRPLGDALDSGNVTKMLEGWGVDRAEKRAVYRTAAEGVRRLKAAEVPPAPCGDDENSGEVDVEALGAAKDAAVGAVSDPVTLFDEQRGMLSLPAVVALGGSPSTKSLYELLRIIQEGKLDDFESFASSNPSAVTDAGLSRETCVRHMRLLSLCSLAAEHEEIPYSAIGSTLRVDDAEVESWVISAVSSGLLVAKMDQLQKVVLVERCVVRKFGQEQWGDLKGRLDAWKKNVGGILRGLEQSQATAQQVTTQ
eukprot:CAMPEP_0113595622 /NCGR_PEP_ID=MMETSP0015_2-20120614/39844_1 /TAXON_ID=2838 /ORGANISM="Odontella" /LENGTH=413 /DNA_ID=CAMNT_0000502969 /DNA_START=130 /DNA_END=1372 /DNA_ORIENTATION=+ /assembly_acc=CAM_ASM_000160